MSLHRSIHPSLCSASNVLAVALLAGAVCAVDLNAQQSASSPANAAQPSSGKVPAKTAPKQSEPAAGMVVFIDPATGKIRQPDAAEIGTLTGTSPRIVVNSVAPPAEPVMFNGPGGAVGVKLGDDSLSYMVVTKTPDAKLAEDCVTGDKAAAALLSKRATPKTTSAPKKAAGVLDEK